MGLEEVGGWKRGADFDQGTWSLGVGPVREVRLEDQMHCQHKRSRMGGYKEDEPRTETHLETPHKNEQKWGEREIDRKRTQGSTNGDLYFFVGKKWCRSRSDIAGGRRHQRDRKKGIVVVGRKGQAVFGKPMPQHSSLSAVSG